MFTYFIHPVTLSSMDQVLKMRMKEGAAGYGIYVMLLEILRAQESYQISWDPTVIAWQIHEPDVELLCRVVQEYDLFQIENGQLSSPWLIAAMAQHEEKRQKLSEAGKRSAAAKAARKSADATSTLQAPPQPSSNLVGSVSQQTNLKEINQSKEITPIQPQEGEGVVDIFSDDFISRIGKAKTEIFSPDLHAMGLDGDRTHNPAVLITRAVSYSMTAEQFDVLFKATDGCLIGSPRFCALIAAFKHCEQTQFRPSYPFEYFMSRIKDIKS